MNPVSMTKKYTLDGEDFTVLTVTKPGMFPVLGYSTSGIAYEFRADGSNPFYRLIEVSPYADFKIDEPVMVRDTYHQDWMPRFFAGNNAGTPCAWNQGAMKWSAKGNYLPWAQCRRPTAEELAT